MAIPKLSSRLLHRLRKSRLVRIPLHWLHALAPDGYVVVRIQRGALRGRSMMLNLRYQWGYWLGTTEIDAQTVIMEKIRPGDVVFDVGAEVGYFSLLSATRVLPNGCVIAFEPNPSNVRILQQSAKLNSDLPLEVVSKAVGDRRGQAEFATFENSTSISNSSLLGRLAELTNEETKGHTVTVELTDLDSFSEETSLVPAYVKIDVEGAEGLVIKGMQKLLSSAQPHLIIEIHNESARQEVLDQLTAARYTYSFLGRTFESEYPFRIQAEPEL